MVPGPGFPAAFWYAKKTKKKQAQQKIFSSCKNGSCELYTFPGNTVLLRSVPASKIH